MGEKGVILVVDDDRDVTMSLKGFFAALGHDMLTALDGKEAMEVIKTVSLDLILLDMRMPGIDGMEILKYVRKNKPKTKVIVITAYDKEVKEGVEKLGVDGFFAKPIDMSTFLDRVRYLLDSTKDTRAYLAKEKEEEPLKGIPKAKVLFVEPDVGVYGYTCGMFLMKEFNPGEYEARVAFSLKEAMEMFGENSIYGFSPDIVVLYDFNIDYASIDNFAEYVLSISFKPKKIIMHGILPRPLLDIIRLERKGIVYCNQNVLTDEELRRINQRLIDTVRRECIKLNLVKE